MIREKIIVILCLVPILSSVAYGQQRVIKIKDLEEKINARLKKNEMGENAKDLVIKQWQNFKIHHNSYPNKFLIKSSILSGARPIISKYSDLNGDFYGKAKTRQISLEVKTEKGKKVVVYQGVQCPAAEHGGGILFTIGNLNVLDITLGDDPLYSLELYMFTKTENGYYLFPLGDHPEQGVKLKQKVEEKSKRESGSDVK